MSVLSLLFRGILHLIYLISRMFAKEQPTEQIFSKRRIKKIAIVGCGPSGMSALKNFLQDQKQHQYDRVVAFEKSPRFGGVWNLSKESPMYESLHTNTSRQMMTFSDFPLKNTIADYPSYEQIHDYLNAYGDHFKLRPYVQFETTVTRVQKVENKIHNDRPLVQWNVTTVHNNKETTELFDAVLISNGHYNIPRFPKEYVELSQTYKKGKVVHSKDYKNNDMFKDKVVVVVGLAASGSEICARIATAAKTTYASCRENTIVVPKYAWGKPTDQIGRRRCVKKLPILLQKIIELILVASQTVRGQAFRQVNKKLPKNVTPGISTECGQMIGDGRIHITLPMASFNKDTITFPVYGQEEPLVISPDYVVLCTGYDLEFSFFDPKQNILDIDPAIRRVMPLYKQIFHIKYPNLAFAGLPLRVEPILASETQVRYIDAVWSGEVGLPSEEGMNQDNTNRENYLKKNGIQLRFWHVVDHLTYVDDLARHGKFYAHSCKWSNSDMFVPLVFWPASPFQYRIDGRGSMPSARTGILTNW
ncbi:dimethylaniline monooxygenase [Acrasis kona]|uniref:Dimethylaniline monooxygenase n=1 Tax=Acrasis kona TaxID=1008807 RepID=A0AAW2ZK46_9EUKA